MQTLAPTKNWVLLSVQNRKLGPEESGHYYGIKFSLLIKLLYCGWLFWRHEVVSFSYITAVRGSIFKGKGIACSLQNNCNTHISLTNYKKKVTQL